MFNTRSPLGGAGEGYGITHSGSHPITHHIFASGRLPLRFSSENEIGNAHCLLLIGQMHTDLSRLVPANFSSRAHNHKATFICKLSDGARQKWTAIARCARRSRGLRKRVWEARKFALGTFVKMPQIDVLRVPIAESCRFYEHNYSLGCAHRSWWCRQKKGLDLEQCCKGLMGIELLGCRYHVLRG